MITWTLVLQILLMIGAYDMTWPAFKLDSNLPLIISAVWSIDLVETFLGKDMRINLIWALGLTTLAILWRLGWLWRRRRDLRWLNLRQHRDLLAITELGLLKQQRWWSLVRRQRDGSLTHHWRSEQGTEISGPPADLARRAEQLYYLIPRETRLQAEAAWHGANLYRCRVEAEDPVKPNDRWQVPVLAYPHKGIPHREIWEEGESWTL